MADLEATTPTGVTTSPFHRTFYANTVKLRVTGTDLGISFAVVTDHPADPAQNVIQQEAVAILPFGVAKILAVQLSQIIAEFEAKFGTIKVPPGNAMAPGMIKSINLQDNI